MMLSAANNSDMVRPLYRCSATGTEPIGTPTVTNDRMNAVQAKRCMCTDCTSPSATNEASTEDPP